VTLYYAVGVAPDADSYGVSRETQSTRGGCRRLARESSVLSCRTLWVKRAAMRLVDLAAELDAVVEGDPDREILGVASIESAGEGDVTFLANAKYRPLLSRSRAAAIIVGRDERIPARESGARRDAGGVPSILRVADPYVAFANVLALFDRRVRPRPGIHPTAVVASSARLGASSYVGPYAVIGDNVVIGRDACIYPHVTIYPDARIGDRFVAHAGAVVREASHIGDDVTLQPGVVLGGDGFGFIARAASHALAIPQIGTVEVGDRVDIGANSTVDRATVGTTKLADDVKLDNLVMIAHGCEVGEGSMLAAQFGMAGSARIGKGVMAGGQVGVSGHLRVGDGVRLAAQTGVAGDVVDGRIVAGSPAVEIGLWRRCSVLLRQLPELFKRVRALEAAVARVVDRAGLAGSDPDRDEEP